MMPGPTIFANSTFSPALTIIAGDIFHPCPKSLAYIFPVPSVAAPPIPFSPVKFSAEMDLDFIFVSFDRPEIIEILLSVILTSPFFLL